MRANDRKIVDLLRETGTINARMVRIALDLGAVSASRVLSDLVERGVLLKSSGAQRGPSVTYGPGPRFPVTRTRRASRAPSTTHTSGGAPGSGLFDLGDDYSA